MKPSSPTSRTKETVVRLSFFDQSMVAKTVETPVFPEKRNHRGIFRAVTVIRIYLQPLFPISVDLAPTGGQQRRICLRNTFCIAF